MALLRLASLLQAEKLPGAAELAGVLTRLAAGENDITQKAALLEQAAAVHERFGAMDEALELHRQGVAIAPPNHPIWAAAGRAFIRAGRYDDLLALWDRASQAVPAAEQASWLMRSADVLARRLGRTDEAIVRLRRVLELAPGSGAAHQLLQALLEGEERWKELAAQLAIGGPDATGGPLTTAHLLRRAALAEACGDDAAALDLYGQAILAGAAAVALVPWTRLAAARGLWEPLALHYGDPAPGALMAVHARYRAAELYAERLQRVPEAIRLLEALLVDEPGQLTALLPLARLATQPPLVATVYQELLAASSDAPTRAQALARAARALEAQGLTGDAISLREQLLAEHPRDLVNQEALRADLERQVDRTRLVSFLQVLAGDARSDAQVRSTVLVDLARVQEELGQWREAADGLEASLELDGPLPSVLARLALPGLYGTLSDETRHKQALAQLAERLPAGPERACCLRRLAQRLLRGGQLDAAASALESALSAYPGDGETLVALGALLDKLGRQSALVDALMRAFAQETEPGRHGRLGVALAARLIQDGRLVPARATVERVLALSESSLPGLMLLAELDDRERAWATCARRLRSVAAHPQAGPAVRLRALSELATLQALRLDDPGGARETLAQMTGPDGDDAETLLARLEVEQAIGDHPARAATLEALARLAGSATPEEGWFLLKLAQLQAETMDQDAAAVATLDRISTPGLSTEVIDSLLAVAARSGRWELVAPSLERLLDGTAAALDPDREAEVRLQLGRLCEGVPEQRPAAARHYARVVQLGRADQALLERLAALEAEADPRRAIDHHRALLAADPGRLASYRALVRLFETTGDLDGTFSAGALLAGLGEADEDETYFHRQRRQHLRETLSGGPLSAAELDLLCPERATPLFSLLGVLAPVLGEIFPLDAAAYGPEGGAGGAPGASGSPLLQIFDPIARLLGTSYRLRHCLPRLGPTVEPGAPAVVLVPRTLEDSPPREQVLVAALTLGRVAFHGVLADPRRSDPLAPRVLEQLLLAACELGDPGSSSPGRGQPLFEDLKKRLAALRHRLAPDALAAAVAAVRGAGAPPVDAGAVIASMNRAAARTALLLSADPATAIAWLRKMEPPTDGRRPDWMSVLPEVVAAGPLAARRRLGIGVGANP
jgi:tetratricopeptide (TPR) repeat protein